MGRAFNWDRVKRLQRMERAGFAYVLAGLGAARLESETRWVTRSHDVSSTASPAIGEPTSSEKFNHQPAPTLTEVIEEAAILFAISAARYGKNGTTATIHRM